MLAPITERASRVSRCPLIYSRTERGSEREGGEGGREREGGEEERGGKGKGEGGREM